ncbi:MAG TPA: L,D-transpeptidase, partial [Clostridia bacterium]|nr:L,D-transpeptidase [Clostridia bacterium]
LPQKPQTNLQPGQKEEITPQLKADPVEENINGVDVEKDFNLTEEAEKEGYTEQDLLIPQEEVEKYREEIKRGEVIPLDKKGGNSDNQGQVNNSANGENVSQQAQLPQVEVVKEFATALPQGVIKELRYTNYPISYDYVLITKPDVNIRKEPNTRAEVISTGELYEKINLLQQVKGESVNGSDVWYRIFWKNDDQVQHGFVFGGGAEPRSFQFDKMLKAINDLKAEVDNNQTAFVFNYKNRNGMPPQYQGKDVDPNGNVRSQSAPGYVSTDPNSDFRYFPDGMLVTVLGEDENFYRVKSLSFPGEYWIPKAYISFWNSIQNLTQVIVVDRKNQNQATFENVNGSWKMISYTFCTTGLPGEYSLETPLGAYMAIEKKDRFFYTAEGSDQIAGYAPYAIRFSAGGYIHGVPVAYEKKDGEEVDPGLIEYLYTIGTTPRSHKCVRNFTSHALFLYNWAQIGNCAVVVIE